MGPFSAWTVKAFAEVVLTQDRTTDLLEQVRTAAEEHGGFLCGLSFPDRS